MGNRLPGYSEETLPSKFKPGVEERKREAGAWCREEVKEMGRGKQMRVECDKRGQRRTANMGGYTITGHVSTQENKGKE